MIVGRWWHIQLKLVKIPTADKPAFRSFETATNGMLNQIFQYKQNIQQLIAPLRGETHHNKQLNKIW